MPLCEHETPGECPNHGNKKPRERVSSAPTRGVSAYLALMAKIEQQLERWDAEMDAVHVAPTDKVRTLLNYARDELRDYDRQTITRVLHAPIARSPTTEG